MQQKDNCKVEFLFKYDRNLSFIDLLVDQNLSVVRYGYLNSKGFVMLRSVLGATLLCLSLLSAAQESAQGSPQIRLDELSTNLGFNIEPFSNGRMIRSEGGVVEPEVPESRAIPIQGFEWGGDGTRSYGTSEESLARASDGDIETMSDRFVAVYSGSIVWSQWIFLEPYTGTLSAHISHGTSNGYGNRAFFQVACFDEENNKTEIFYNKSKWTNSSPTYQSFTKTVNSCVRLKVWVRDTGNGAPYFWMHDVIRED